MLNRIGTIFEPCGIPISVVLLDEYVLPIRVQIHLSDKKFLKYWNIIPIIHVFQLFIIIDHFYIALFSALQRIHHARMWFYMSE